MPASREKKRGNPAVEPVLISSMASKKKKRFFENRIINPKEIKGKKGAGVDWRLSV